MNNLTSTFNAAAGPSGEASAVTSGPNPTGPVSPNSNFGMASQIPASSSIPPEPTSALTIESAEAELQTLEVGRAKPAPRHNQDPSQPLKKIVDSKVERQREARISALKAYVQAREIENSIEMQLDQSKNLEPTFG